MQWYYAVGDQRHGPVEQAEFEQLVSNGTIKGETLVWRQGMADWQSYAVAVGVATGTPARDDGTEVCAVSGKRYPRREMISYEGKWISAEHRDAFFQRMREGIAQPNESAVPGPFGYGGFGRRFAARFVDGILQMIIGMILGATIGAAFGAAGALRPGNTGMFYLMQAVIQLASFGVGLLYEVYFVRKYDATPGKIAVGLKILRPDGAKLTVGRIIGRYFATIVSAIPLGIGYLMVAFDDERRALHDRIADTRVIQTK